MKTSGQVASSNPVIPPPPGMSTCGSSLLANLLFACGLAFHAAAAPGALDPSFQPSLAPGPGEAVEVVARDPQGRLLVAHGRALARLTADGTPDAAFVPGAADGRIRVIRRQSDGRLLVGGEFGTFAGASAPGIVRLLENGEIDPSFTVAAPTGSRGVLDLVIQADGKVVVAGNFSNWEGTAVPNITRLESTGAHDPTFAHSITPAFTRSVVDRRVVPGITHADGSWVFAGGSTETSSSTTVSGTMWRVAPRPDGSLLVDGAISGFFSKDGVELARIPGAGRARAWLPLADGGALVAISEGDDAGIRSCRLRRLRSDGTWDASLDARHDCDGEVRAIVLQNDGRIVLAGGFTGLGGHRLPLLARLQPDGSLDRAFVADLDLGPVRWETPDRSVYRNAAAPAPHAGVLGLVPLPDGALLAHGEFLLVPGGARSGLARIPRGEEPLGAPTLGSTTGSVDAREGDPIRLGFTVRSATPVEARWTRDGQPMDRGTRPVLDFPRVRISDAGEYQLRIGSASGFSTSAPVVLRVTPAPTHPGSVDFAFDVTRPMPWNDGPSAALPGHLRALVTGDRIYALSAHPLDAFEAGPGHRSYGVARLLAHGAVDPAFVLMRGDTNIARLDGVGALLALRDGRLLAALNLAPIPGDPNSRAHHQLRALREDGSVDATFVLGVEPRTPFSEIGPLVEIADGRILVAGDFATTEPTARLRLVRVLADGRRDATYASPPGNVVPKFLLPRSNGGVTILLEDLAASSPTYLLGGMGPDGATTAPVPVTLPFVAPLLAARLDHQDRILWAPRREQSTIPLLVRRLPDGTVDPTFHLALRQPPMPAQARVRALAVQPDGGILLAASNFGVIPDPANQPDSLIRLLPDGGQDPEFRFEIPLIFTIDDLHISPDRQILASGSFASLGQPLLRDIAMLSSRDDGRLEALRFGAEGFAATLHTRRDRRYRIETCVDLGSADWRPHRVLEGTGAPVEVTDEPADRRFYRVTLER